MAVLTNECANFHLSESERDQILLEIGEDIENPTLTDSDWCNILTDRLFLFPGIKRGDIIGLPGGCFDEIFDEDEDEGEEEEEYDEYKNYNNRGFIFDGERVVNLENRLGFPHIPSRFTVEEFGLECWSYAFESYTLEWFIPSQHDFSTYEKVDDNLFLVEENGYRFVIAHHEDSNPEDLIEILRGMEVANGDCCPGTIESKYDNYISVDLDEFKDENYKTIYLTFDENQRII